MTDDDCTKCGIRDRVPGQRLCRECRKEYDEGRKRKRANGANAADGKRAGDTTAAAKEIEALRIEVARLKRDLAEANAKLANTVVFTRDEVAVSVSGPKRAGGAACIHGSRNCQALACRVRTA